MPVYIKARVKEGWKAKENERRGGVLVWVFCDEKTHKVLFEYAPNLVDQAFFVKGFEDLKLYDELNKAVAKFEDGINTSQTTIDWNSTCRLKNKE